MNLLRTIALTLSLGMVCMTTASAGDFEVGQMKFSSTGWGKQNAMIPLTSLAPDYRFVVAVGEATFTGAASGSPKLSKKIFIVEPMAADTLRFPVEIPGNFGQGTVDIGLYTVVDTLDRLLESQRFFSSQLEFNIEVPSGLKAFVPTGLQVPLFVARNSSFDNILARVIAFLVDKGKSLEEIASICEADPWYVKTVATRLIEDGHLSLTSSGYKTNFAIIEGEQVEALVEPIEAAVDGLHSVIVGNLPAYDSTLKAMVSAGTLTGDPDDLFDGGSILYHKHPAILGLLLWNTLGLDFVNDGTQFSIFTSSDLCNASMGDYMHMVAGGDDLMGESFYHFTESSGNEWFYCGRVSSVLPCDPNYEGKRERPINMFFDEDKQPLYFSYSVDKLRVPLSILMDGTSEYIIDLKKQVDKTFGGADNDALRRGTRYWCWNLVVTRLLDVFESEKVFDKEGAGVYILQRVDT